MKVLDVYGFQAGLEEIQQNLRTLNEQVLELEQAVQRIIGLEEALKGNGGDSIRQYYQQIHQTFLIFFQSFIANYDKIIEKIGYNLHTFELAKNGWIHESFVDENVQFGLRKIQSISESLTHETNDVMASVEDLVPLPRLKDEATQFGIQQAKDQAKRAIEQLHLFDQQATKSLEPIEKDIQKMTVFIQQAEAMFRGDQDILIHFEPVKLLGQSGYLSLMGDSSPFTEEEEQNLRDYLIALEKGEVEPNLKGEYPDDFTMENNIFPNLPGKDIHLDPKLKAILAFGWDISWRCIDPYQS
ncbi:T7SS effector LXG polymorphic toxin [Cytobacillus sp. Hz8]|uniref:T7SS effector LXG polymorphic toxin n=1 Tax=Cytobacillus sp. Hz8 TaxID=3347168 RepID=UPI0035DE005A